MTVPKPYHHGDLRAALVRSGLELITKRSAADVSLREIARHVGVSANAVYRHFSDKEALLRALAFEGLKQLADAQHAAANDSGSGAEQFAATGKAYVRFAMENPALFRLMFASPARGGASLGPNPGSEAMIFLRENAAATARSGEDKESVALRAWSLAHGLAMLVIDGQISPSESQIQSVFDIPKSTGSGHELTAR